MILIIIINRLITLMLLQKRLHEALLSQHYNNVCFPRYKKSPTYRWNQLGEHSEAVEHLTSTVSKIIIRILEKQ